MSKKWPIYKYKETSTNREQHLFVDPLYTLYIRKLGTERARTESGGILAERR
jgi:hypothetical protein